MSIHSINDMKIAYWISTLIITTFILWSAYTYLFSKTTIDGIRALGFPNYFRVQLAILKLIAVAIILIPNIPIQVKEWAYAGIGLFLITAIVAHMVHKDPFFITAINLILLVVLAISNIYLHRLINLN